MTYKFLNKCVVFNEHSFVYKVIKEDIKGKYVYCTNINTGEENICFSSLVNYFRLATDKEVARAISVRLIR